MIFESQQEQDEFLRNQSWLLEGIDHAEYFIQGWVRESDPEDKPVVSRDAEFLGAVIFGAALMIRDSLNNGRKP